MVAEDQKPSADKANIKLNGHIQIGERSTWAILLDREIASAKFLVNGTPSPYDWDIAKNGQDYEAASAGADQLVFDGLSDFDPASCKLKVEMGSKSIVTPTLVPLWTNPIGIFANVLGANSISIPAEKKGESHVYQSAISLPREGVYTCNLYLGEGVQVSKVVGKDISPDLEGEDSEIKFTAGRGGRHGSITFQLQSDESCVYEIDFCRDDAVETSCKLLLMSTQSLAPPNLFL